MEDGALWRSKSLEARDGKVVIAEREIWRMKNGGEGKARLSMEFLSNRHQSFSTFCVLKKFFSTSLILHLVNPLVVWHSLHIFAVYKLSSRVSLMSERQELIVQVH